MPAYNNYYPASYQNPFQQGYYQPIVQPQQVPQIGQPAQSAQPQMMTPPTIHADIIQVSSIDQVKDASVGAGMSQMFMTQDEKTIIVKSASSNGYTLDIYDKRPPTPPAPTFDPKAYVRKDEIEDLIVAFMSKSANTSKKEATEE